MKVFNIISSKFLACACAVTMGAALWSCSDEIDAKIQDGGDQGAISFRCTDMLEVYKGPNNTASRAGGSKSPEERKINTLHVFFFDQTTGQLLSSPTYSNFKPYQKLNFNGVDENGNPKTSSPLIKVPTGDDLFESGNNNVHIVALANIDATDEASSAVDDANSFFTDYTTYGKISENSRSGEPLKITCYDDIKKWVYWPRMRMSEATGEGDITKLPAAGMPMIGELENVDLTQKPLDTYIVNLTALMAKINISVSLEPDQSIGALPTLKITEYGVKNMPIAVPFTQPTGEFIGTNPRPESYADYLLNYDVTDASMYHSNGTASNDPTDYTCTGSDHEFTTTKDLPVTIDKDSDPVTFSYYTYENINVPDYSAKRANGEDAFNSDLTPNYPTGVTEDRQKQRWKPTIAHTNRASALVLKGEYTTHQGLRYQAQFTIYLGSDATTDFKVKRNHRYDNNITIHGLEYIRNSQDEVFNFDGRINVVDDNPFYLALVNELNVDAHATALPMDVWFMLRENGDGTFEDDADVDWDSQIEFEIQNPETTNWIRMEKVPRSTMYDAASGRFIPGAGARDYFTTDLVTNTLKDNWKVTVDGKNDQSRSRIYFYIDENIPTANNAAVPSRQATINVTYTRTNGDGSKEIRNRTLDIIQNGMLRVTVSHSQGGTINNTYIEYVEEYLSHNDPLEGRVNTGEYFQGIKWGVDGAYRSALNNFAVFEVYDNGLQMTQNVINSTLMGSISNIKLFNFDEEMLESAFHYCYGKNKRNQNGTVPTTGLPGYWYMPGIRELERAITQYYEVFKDFQGNFYWSASAGKYDNILASQKEVTNKARATKANVTQNANGTYTINFVESNESKGDEGSKPRSDRLRVRAFYKRN